MATDRSDKHGKPQHKSRFSQWRERRRKARYTAKLTGASSPGPSAGAQRARFESETIGRQGGLG